jgi:hypothetical protein
MGATSAAGAGSGTTITGNTIFVFFIEGNQYNTLTGGASGTTGAASTTGAATSLSPVLSAARSEALHPSAPILRPRSGPPHGRWNDSALSHHRRRNGALPSSSACGRLLGGDLPHSNRSAAHTPAWTKISVRQLGPSGLIFGLIRPTFVYVPECAAGPVLPAPPGRQSARSTFARPGAMRGREVLRNREKKRECSS